MYNSCCDRHCPTCQGGRRAQWLDQRQAELLPVEYYQVVFTVPEQLYGIAAAHPETFYNLLFRAARETLLEVAAAPEHLGAQIGGLMVLHTWGQTLQLHPHLHVIVPGGGLRQGTGSDQDERRQSPASESASSPPSAALGLLSCGLLSAGGGSQPRCSAANCWSFSSRSMRQGRCR